MFRSILQPTHMHNVPPAVLIINLLFRTCLLAQLYAGNIKTEQSRWL